VAPQIRKVESFKPHNSTQIETKTLKIRTMNITISFTKVSFLLFRKRKLMDEVEFFYPNDEDLEEDEGPIISLKEIAEAGAKSFNETQRCIAERNFLQDESFRSSRQKPPLITIVWFEKSFIKITPDLVKRAIQTQSFSIEGAIQEVNLGRSRADLVLFEANQYDSVLKHILEIGPSIASTLGVSKITIKKHLDYLQCLIRVHGFHPDTAIERVAEALFELIKIPRKDLIGIEIDDPNPVNSKQTKRIFILRYTRVPSFFLERLAREVVKKTSLLEKKKKEGLSRFTLLVPLIKQAGFNINFDFPIPWKPYQKPCARCGKIFEGKYPVFHPPPNCPYKKVKSEKTTNMDAEKDYDMKLFKEVSKVTSFESDNKKRKKDLGSHPQLGEEELEDDEPLSQEMLENERMIIDDDQGSPPYIRSQRNG